MSDFCFNLLVRWNFLFLNTVVQHLGGLALAFYITGSILKETKHMNYSFLASGHYFIVFC